MKTGAHLWLPAAATGPVQPVKHAAEPTSCSGHFPSVRCHPLPWLPSAAHHAVRCCEVVLDALRYNLNPAVGRRIISSVLPNLLRMFGGFNGRLSVLQRVFKLASVLIGSRPATGQLCGAERRCP